MSVEIRNSMLSSDDVAYFSPKLRDWGLTLRNINLLFDGVVSDFGVELKSLAFGRSSRVQARGRVTGLPEIAQTRFSLTFDDVTTEAADIGRLAAGIGRKDLPDKTLSMMDRAGTLRLTGEVEGSLASFRSQFALTAPVGSVSAELAMQPADGRRRRPVRGRVAVRRFRAGEVLGQPKLGSVSFEADVDGVVGRELVDARIDGSITQLEFNDYPYDSLRFDGRLTEKTFNGRVRADDPALRFDFQGEVGFDPRRPHYDFDLDLIHADLARMRFNRRDSVSVLSALVKARASGRTLDDMNGVVTVSDVRYRYNADTLRTKLLTLSGQNDTGSKYLSLQSEFADATFRSRTDYRTVFAYLQSSVEKYVPLLSDKQRARRRTTGAVSVVDDYSVLSVDVKHFTPVADAVSDGLQIADGSQLRLLFNPANDKLSLKATSEYIERERMLATRLNLNATNLGDSLSVYLRSEDFYLGTFHLPQLSVMGGARSDRLRMSAGFNDTTARVSALLGLEALVGQSPERGRTVDVRLLPSHISRKGTTWQIFARNIRIDTARVVVDRFRVMNNDQELLIDGTASRSRQDSVMLRLRQFRSGALHPDRREDGLCHRGAHQRAGGDEIGARGNRDHGRHPHGQRGGQRPHGSAAASDLDVGFQERPRARDGDRPPAARYARPRLLCAGHGALLCRGAAARSAHESARPAARRGDLRDAGGGGCRADDLGPSSSGAVGGFDPHSEFPDEG